MHACSTRVLRLRAFVEYISIKEAPFRLAGCHRQGADPPAAAGCGLLGSSSGADSAARGAGGRPGCWCATLPRRASRAAGRAPSCPAGCLQPSLCIELDGRRSQPRLCQLLDAGAGWNAATTATMNGPAAVAACLKPCSLGRPATQCWAWRRGRLRRRSPPPRTATSPPARATTWRQVGPLVTAGAHVMHAFLSAAEVARF